MQARIFPVKYAGKDELSEIYISDDFMAVYQAALNLDIKQLNELMSESNIFLDVKDQTGLYTPAGMLAAEQNHGAVILLLQLGAHPGYAALGAAKSGDVVFADLLRKKFGATINELAIGAAMAADTTYADKLQQTYVDNSHLYASTAIARPLLFGYGLSNNTNKIAELGGQLQPELVCCRARNGATLEELIEHIQAIADKYGADSDEASSSIQYALLGASACNATEVIRGLLHEIHPGDADHVYANHHILHANCLCIKNVLNGLAAGGHIKECMDLVHSFHLPLSVYDKYRKIIISNAIASGHFNEVLKVKELDFIYAGKPSLLSRFKYWSHSKIVYDEFPVTKGLMQAEDLAAYKRFVNNLKHSIDEMITSPLFAGDVAAIYCNKYITKYSSGDFVSESILRFISNIYHELGYARKKSVINKMMEQFNQVNGATSFLAKLHIFSFLNREFLQALLAKIDDNQHHVFSHLVNTAYKINTFMQKYDFDFDQAHEFLTNRCLRNYLVATSFQPISAATPKDVNNIILCKLSCLPDCAIIDMAKKYSLNKHGQRDIRKTTAPISRANSPSAHIGIFKRDSAKSRSEKSVTAKADNTDRHSNSIRK